jgi:hypothetical protein
MEMKMTQDPREGTTSVTGTFHDHELWATDARKFVQSVAQQVEQAIVGHVAEKFLAEHLQEVMAAINPQAVANLALVKVAQQVMEQVLQPKAQER